MSQVKLCSDPITEFQTDKILLYILDMMSSSDIRSMMIWISCVTSDVGCKNLMSIKMKLFEE